MKRLGVIMQEVLFLNLLVYIKFNYNLNFTLPFEIF